VKRREKWLEFLIATLAFGRVAATTVSTVLVDVVLCPLDFESPQELVFITESCKDGSQIYSVVEP